MDNIVYTGDENERRQDEALAELQAKAAMIVGGSAVGLGIASHFIDKNEQARELFSKLPGANRYSKKYDIARIYSMQNGAIPVDLRDMYANQSAQRSALSILSSIEELSPMGVLKTLQLSNFLEPFTKLSADKAKVVRLTNTAVQANEDLYRSMLLKHNKTLSNNALIHGLILKDGKLYESNKAGEAVGDALLEHARLVTTHVKMGERISPNRVLQKYANVVGGNLGRGGFHSTQTAVIGSDNHFGLVTDWMRAYVRQGMEIGYKTMDNPLSGIEDILKATGIETLPFAETDLYKKIKSNLNVNLGTGGVYNLSTRESIGLMAKNTTLKLGGMYLGYQGLNHVLNKVTDEGSIWHDGVASGLASIYGDTRVALAKVLADPFQKYKDNQEAAAEGSTSLLTLAGFPIAGATLGASLSYYRRMFDSMKDGVESATSRSERAAEHGVLQPLFKRFGIGNMAPYKSSAIKGALVGGLVALPFLPGALIGKSSTELEEEYSGKRQVENRSNRWWLMGGNRYEGDQIKNYQSSLVHRLKENPRLHAEYKGDMSAQLKEDPLYSPLSFIRDPYRKEKRTQDSSPYPVWGMEVTSGSFLGRLFQGTVGEIIKPTILSPEFKAQLAIGGQAPNGELVQAGRNGTNIDVAVVGTNDAKGYKLATKEGLESSKDGSDKKVMIKNSDGSYSVPVVERPRDRKLIDSDMMLRQDNAYVNEVSQPLKKAYSAVGDFVGLKGYLGNTLLNSMGINLEESNRQLARSGQGDTLANRIKEQNFGDMGGLGEFQRRMVPTSAAAKQDTINPLKNKVAPSWLPKDASKYYIDFSQGDYWSKVANAHMRLPGEGYASLNPSMKGVDPEKYSDVHKFRILSDVARGSAEQIALKKQLMAKSKAGELSEEDLNLFNTTMVQERNKSVQKKFNEYLTEDQKKSLSGGGRLLNKLWETVAHNAENPLEAMTPFRPASKFIHQRSAIEDYNKTMLQGPDTGIWSNPYSHFIRVAWNRSLEAILPGIQKPKEAIERDNVEEYFDKLSYLKARKNNNINDALKTTVGRTNVGIYDKDSMHKFKAGLSPDQRAYVEAFAKETDASRRKEILRMLPKNVADGYMDIWNNINIAENAKREGKDPTQAIQQAHIKATNNYEKQYNINLNVPTRDSKNKPLSAFQQSIEKRLKMADMEAEGYIKEKTGVPSKDWVGWDPRLTMNDIKIRTLTVGKADIFRYGFWEADQKRNERIVALDKEAEVTNKLATIRKTLRDNNVQKEYIRRQMLDKGIVAKNVELTPASRNDVRVAVQQSEK